MKSLVHFIRTCMQSVKVTVSVVQQLCVHRSGVAELGRRLLKAEQLGAAAKQNQLSIIHAALRVYRQLWNTPEKEKTSQAAA